MFHIGQEVVCVDDSPVNNPWHNQHPLIKNKIYIVLGLAPTCICIDPSGRFWHAEKFRPLTKTTSIQFAHDILARSNKKLYVKRKTIKCP